MVEKELEFHKKAMWIAINELKEKLQKEAEPILCPKCLKKVKPIIRITPTLLGDLEIEHLCPVHKITLTRYSMPMQLPKRTTKKLIRGLYVAVEGIDGAGKTTICKFLVDKLEKDGYRVKYVVEPYIKAIKEFLYKYPTDPDVETYLFAADRIILQKSIIIPALEQGYIVISDRSIYSNIAYQSVRGLSEEFIVGVNRAIKYPDIVVLLDIDATTAIDRIKKAGRRLTKFESIEFLEKVRNKFLQISKRYNNLSSFYIVDSNKPLDKVKEKCLQIIIKALEGVKNGKSA